MEFGVARRSRVALVDGHARSRRRRRSPARPLAAACSVAGARRPVRQPGRRQDDRRQRRRDAGRARSTRSSRAAERGFAQWSRTPVAERAAALERLADLLEGERDALVVAACPRGRQDARRRHRRGARGGRLCRYYAAEARRLFAEDEVDAGPDRRDATCSAVAAAASSSASRRGISRWRSSSARSPRRSPPATRSIAKPAEQTPLIAFRAFELLHQAGVPIAAAQLAPGDGRIGAALVGHRAGGGRRLHRLDRDRLGDQPRARRARTARSCRSSPRPAASTP